MRDFIAFALLVVSIAASPASADGQGFAVVAKEKYVAYWLTADPPDPNSAEYEPILLLSFLSIERLAELPRPPEGLPAGRNKGQMPLLDAVALTIETYKKDSIWNPDGRPFRVDRLFSKVDAQARKVKVDGKTYRYEDCSLEDLVHLLDHPEGTVPLHRLHGPLAGFTRTARALTLLLKEQLASEKLEKKN